MPVRQNVHGNSVKLSQSLSAEIGDDFNCVKAEKSGKTEAFFNRFYWLKVTKFKKQPTCSRVIFWCFLGYVKYLNV
jgi:hypothetical protein